MGKVIEGNSLYISTKKAMEIVSTLIEKNKDNVDKYKGIPIEKELEVIKE
jgi:pyridoxine kinase